MEVGRLASVSIASSMWNLKSQERFYREMKMRRSPIVDWVRSIWYSSVIVFFVVWVATRWLERSVAFYWSRKGARCLGSVQVDLSGSGRVSCVRAVSAPMSSFEVWMIPCCITILLFRGR